MSNDKIRLQSQSIASNSGRLLGNFATERGVVPVSVPAGQRKPICIDLFCGLGGWADGFLAEGWDVIGFDIERHDYGSGGYPAQLVLQDVRTLHGSQFKDAAVIVASPPCQRYSYMAMPWSRAKAMAKEIRASQLKWAELNELFVACFRIAQEAGVPLIVENVRGAQPWVGPSRWNYGSFYLWGDIPALMPAARQFKVGRNFHQFASTGIPSASFHGAAHENKVIVAELLASRSNESQKGLGGGWFEKPYKERGDITGRFNSKSDSRKAASAQIAKIPFQLARHIARCFKPQPQSLAERFVEA